MTARRELDWLQTKLRRGSYPKVVMVQKRRLRVVRAGTAHIETLRRQGFAIVGTFTREIDPVEVGAEIDFVRAEQRELERAMRNTTATA